MRAYTQKQQQLLVHWSEALGTEAFQSHRITLDHLSNPPASPQVLERLALELDDSFSNDTLYSSPRHRHPLGAVVQLRA
jgi:hypothetical protein